MSKFTSEEVETLQEGGNQRARETFLKDWDLRMQRLPDSSNADKVREFIKRVYVDGKYSGAKTSGIPSRDVLNLSYHEHETRRASSYHSYSQSPPYDYQYEERRYGKQAPALTRKPGSDRGNYGKLFSFLSPSRLRDHVQEDRFANEVPNARVTDYSVSSRSDPARSATQSPNFQRDTGFSSPSSEKSRDILSEDVQQYKLSTFSNINGKIDADQASHAQRTASSGSFGSFNSRAMSFDSVDSVGEKYIAPAPEKLVETNHTIVPTFPSFLQSLGFEMSNGLELFSAAFVHQTITSTTSAIDLFQLPQPSSTSGVDISQPSPISMIPTSDWHQQSQAFTPSSLDFLPVMPRLESTETLKDKSPDLVIQKNEGWATFDVSSHVEPSQGIESSIPMTVCSSNSESLGKFEQLSSSNTSSYWPPYQDFSASRPSSMHNQRHEGLHSVEAPFNATSNNSWSPFEDNNVTFQSIHEQSGGQVAVEDRSVADQYLVWGISEDLQNSQVQQAPLDTRPPILSTASHAIGSSDASFALPITEEAHLQGSDRKSRNPFDLPCDSDFESSQMFLDMSSF